MAAMGVAVFPEVEAWEVDPRYMEGLRRQAHPRFPPGRLQDDRWRYDDRLHGRLLFHDPRLPSQTNPDPVILSLQRRQGNGQAQ